MPRASPICGATELTPTIRRRPRPFDRARGQSLVEFALILPLFVLLLAAVVDVSRLIALQSSAVAASREAARYGAAVGDNASGVARYVDCSGIRAAARTATGALVALTDSQIRVSYDDGAGGARSNPCAPHGSGPAEGDIQNLDRVIVEVTATFEVVTPVVRQLIGPISVSSVDRRTIVTAIP